MKTNRRVSPGSESLWTHRFVLAESVSTACLLQLQWMQIQMKQINQTAPALPQLNNPFLPPAGKTAAIKVELKTENFAFTQPGFLQRAVGYEQGGGGREEGGGGWVGRCVWLCRRGSGFWETFTTPQLIIQLSGRSAQQQTPAPPSFPPYSPCCLN